MPEMKVPGPDHPITITANPKRVQVGLQRPRHRRHRAGADPEGGGLQAGASTSRATDVDMDYFSRTERTTHCPYKGEANYFTIFMDGSSPRTRSGPTRTPIRPWTQIRGFLAFYPNKVEIQELGDATSRKRCARPSSTPTTAPARANASTGRPTSGLAS